jgi:tRNA-splicing ligase RtcB (3'-phosphate/5'-hydroxy nucleic acid ligase)
MNVIATEKHPIKSWCADLEAGALQQAKNMANLPFVFKHVALMPDAHQGYGIPIGGVLATEGVIIPAAVGVDIGCGMCAMKTNIFVDQGVGNEWLKSIMGEVRKRIPVGFDHHKEEQADVNMPPRDTHHLEVIRREYDSALTQVGTLGGGNHFIEFQKNCEGLLWVMIHSGSRNLGFRVAHFYNELAKNLNEQWYSSVPREFQLAFLPSDSRESVRYVQEMNYCVEFAKCNRALMMERIREIINDEFGGFYDFKTPIDIAHNYATMENHFGQNVMVHRKGATLARKGTIGIIPGSQGTKSYIVEGRGNPLSFDSCSHGAGRRMGRKDAQRNLVLKDEIDRLNKQGIIHSVRCFNDLDEATGAYKDIDEVMSQQADLVSVVEELTPLAVIKG